MLSVIIPTRNRSALLRLALNSLLAQNLPSRAFEVLVVDNGSTDDTRAAVESFRPRFGDLRYFFDAEPGLHVGRHVGLKEARGEVLVYADDDIEATPTWLQAIEECFRQPDVALVGGNNYPQFEGTPPRWLQQLWRRRSRTLQGHAIASLSILDLLPGQRAISPLLVWGCNFSIRKSVLLDAGGFHPDSMPEDLVRFRGDGETHVSAHVSKAGLVCLFDSRASVYHAVPKSRMTFDYFKRRAFNQGVSESYTELRNGGDRGDPLNTRREWVARSKAAVGRLRARARAALTLDADMRDLSLAIRQGYDEGRAYHQTAYRNDPEVRAWVHKPNYL